MFEDYRLQALRNRRRKDSTKLAECCPVQSDPPISLPLKVMPAQLDSLAKVDVILHNLEGDAVHRYRSRHLGFVQVHAETAPPRGPTRAVQHFAKLFQRLRKDDYFVCETKM